MTKTTKKVKEETCEVIETPIDSNFAKLLELYKLQSPVKYEAKKAELLKKLETNK